MAQQIKGKISKMPQAYTSTTSTCEGCPKVSAASSRSTNATSNGDVLVATIGQLNELQKEVRELQKENKKKSSFYNSSAKLNNTVRVVVIILLIVPVIQMLCCAGVVYYLGIQDQLPSLINWLLGGVSILSLLELIVGGVKLFLYEKRMDELESKINDLNPRN